jgi:putative membrane-bound dehydrogenase-like protein
MHSQIGGRKHAALSLFAALVGLMANLPAHAAPVSSLFVPEGFAIERAAGSEVVFPMFAAFDDQGALYVAESSGLDLYAELSAQTRKCRIRKLEDRDGDGFFETSTVFAAQLVFPMGLAWRAGKLFVADPPDLVAFTDTTGNGQADRREVILTGFGHKDNGSLHGLIFGPDGLLYMTMGSPDGYRLRQDDGNFLTGASGALIRCRPDGSGVEVVARGFENLIEVVFTGSGEIIGTDNWFQKPAGGIRDALVHIVEGGLYPYAPDTGTRYPVTGDPLPALSLLPAVAVSGIELYRGAAFAGFQGNLFTAQFNSRRVVRHLLTRSGSTFRAEHFDFVTCDPEMDFHPSDVLESADGSLIIVDTGSWYVQHCPTGRIRGSRAAGGLYRVRSLSSEPIRDPWGVEIDWSQAAPEKLGELLGNARPTVRDRAQQTLIARGAAAVPDLEKVLTGEMSLTAKLHAVWSLSGIPGAPSAAVLLKALDRDEAEIVAASASALALRQHRSAGPKLAALLGHPSPQVQLASALALARCGNADSVRELWNALSSESDRFIEHARIHALHRLADTAALQHGLTLPEPRQQKAALLLLNQPPHPRGALTPRPVIELAESSNAELRRAAIHVLKQRRDWAAEAVRLIQDWLSTPEIETSEANALRALLLAYEGNSEIQQLVAASLRESPPPNLLLLIQILAETSLPRLPEPWIDALRSAMNHSDVEVRFAAIRAASVRQIPSLQPDLLRLAEDPAAPISWRLEALRGIISRQPRLSASLFDLVLAPFSRAEEPLLRFAAFELLKQAHLTDIQLLRLIETIPGDALTPAPALLPSFRESTGSESTGALIAFLLGKIQAGWRPSAREWAAFTARLPAAFQEQTAAATALLESEQDDSLARLAEYNSLSKGGDPERGRAHFFNDKTACAACHAIGETGSKIGPDLTRIGAIRSGRDLLESILFPSSTFAQGYESYTLTLSEDREVTGMLVENSPERLVLRDSSGAEAQFHRSEILSMERSAVSAMPDGLERTMSREEFRDLMAFLQSLQ